MPSITKLPDSTVPRSEKDLLYSTLLALGGEGGGITRLPQSETPRSEQDLLYSIMLAAQSISSGGGMDASSQSQAETGANNDTAMTPLRVAQKLAFDLGAPTTIGKSILNLANPEAITFLRMNTNNTASALSASDMRTALGLGTMATQAASAVAITGGTFAGLSVQAGYDSGRISINHDINGVFLGSTTSTIQFYDTYLSRGGAINVLQIGQSSAAPAAQCLKGPGGLGTNIVGGKLSIAPGQSTGNATPGKLALQGTAGGSSGSTAQTLADVLTITNASYITLGDATVAAVLTIGVAASGLTIGHSSGTALGFWGASPVNQYNIEGTGGIYSAGSGTPVLDDSKFTGGAGSKAYTLNDVVAALKACGMMES